MTEGKFPKIDGDVWFASEVNHFFDLYEDVKTYNLSVTTASAALDFSGVSYKYSTTIRNIGYQDCYISLTNTATTSDMFLPAGTELTFTNCTFDDLSAITDSDTTELSVAVFTGIADKTGYKDSSEILEISATDVSSNESFTNTTAHKDVLIVNEGASKVYVAFGATAADTDFILEPREALAVMTAKYQISAICDAGETATVKVIGVYKA
jgi:hypothetical protein